MTTVAISTYVSSYLLDAPVDTLSVSAAGTIGSGGVMTGINGVYSVINSGGIGESSTSNGVLIYRGGTVINDLGATITGGAGNGVNIGQGYEGQGTHTSYGSVVNRGTILGGSSTGNGLFFGYNLLQGVFVTNGDGTNTTVLISGADGIHDLSGLFASVATTITNFGTIQGTGGASYAGIKLDSGTPGTIVNGSLLDTVALISGYIGVDGYGDHAATVQSFGTIQGSSGVAVRLGSDADTLIDEAGAVFLGTVDGSGGTLQLAADAGTGTLTGLGTGFANFGSIAVNAGATWTLNGSNTVAGGSSFADNGTLIDSGVLLNQGSIGLAGQLDVAGTLDNAGSIFASAAYAIRLLPGGYLRNEQGSTINHAGAGSRFNPTVFGAPGGTSTVVNLGVIENTEIGGNAGLYFYGAGQVTNGSTADTTALIQGVNAIYAYWGSLGLTNYGTVSGGVGVLMAAGGQVTNGAAGDTAAAITATEYGILAVRVAATVTNFATIDSGYVGVDLRADGTVINGSSTNSAALMQGRNFGVRLENAGTIINYGTIRGTNGTALSLGSGSDLLRVAAGAVFDGEVLGGNGTLELMSSAVAGTLSGLGTQFNAFNSVQDDADATWTLSGANTVSGGSTLLNSGTLVNAGTLTNDGTLINEGALLDNGVLVNDGVATLSAALTVAGTLSNSGSIDVAAYRALALAPGAYLYNAAGATITQTGSPGSFQPTVFGEAGAIDIRNLGTITNATGDLVLYLSTGGTITNGSSSDTTALITGAVPIYVYRGPGTVINFGTIESGVSGGIGVALIGGGSVTNGASDSSAASIIGPVYGVFGVDGPTTLTNFGTITASYHGVDQRFGTAMVVNTGVIRATGGTGVGVYLHGGGTIVDAGTIAGATTAINLGGTGSNLLVLEQGYALTGAVVGGVSATNTLELQGSTSAPVTATYNSLGLVNFQTIAFASTIGNDATLVITDDAQLPGTIADFTGVGDAIDLTELSDAGNDAIASFDTLTNVLTVSGDNGSVQLQLDSEDYSRTRFLASNDGSGGTLITPEALVPPVIGSTIAGQVTNDETTDQPFASVTIADENTPTQTVTMTITLSNGGSPTDADGVLSGEGLIQTGVGTYSLTAASAAAAQAALQALVFTPTEHQVAPGGTVTTDFQIEVTDGFGLTATDTTTSVVATAVNDPPTITPPTGGDTGVPDQTPIAPFADLSVTDPDVGHIDTLTVTLSDPSGGTLSNLGDGSYDAETGVYTVTGTDDAVTAALRALVFTPAADEDDSVSPTSFTVVVTGPGGGAENTGITITSVQQVFGLGNIPPNQLVISVSPDGTGFAQPTPDMTNEAVVSTSSEGGSYSLPTGYQAEFLGGSADATLSDTSGGNALLVGNTGNDTITASAGNDTLLGGSGDSTLSISGANDIATDPSGNASVTASGPRQSVYGGSGTLSALATGSNDAVGLGSGDARVTLGGSDNTVYAYTGASTIVVMGTGDAVGLYTGDADVTLGGSNDALYAGGGSASIVATGSGNAIGLGTGDARVTVSGTGTAVFGSSGTMSLLMPGDSDTIFGGSGPINATLAGTGDVVGAGTGTTTLLVSGANATIFGNAAGSQLSADIEGANAVVGLNTGDANLTLSGGNAQVFANSGASTILASGGGSDTINLYTGPSSITAGGSTDLLVGTNQSGSLLFAGGAGASTIIGGGNTTMLGAAGGGVTYVGETGAAASFTAADGNETLDAALSGGAVAANGSTIAGSADVLIGGAGNDTLSAGVGATTMTGGGGANLFEFAHVGGGGVTVTDFNSNDTVLLSGYGVSAANTALANATSVNGSTTITLSDNTKITFLNITSATALTGHVISE